MKKLLSLDALAELARAYLKSVWIAAPQWDAEKKHGSAFRHTALEPRVAVSENLPASRKLKPTSNATSS